MVDVPYTAPVVVPMSLEDYYNALGLVLDHHSGLALIGYSVTDADIEGYEYQYWVYKFKFTESV